MRRKDDKLTSCGIRGGGTVQIVSRLRSGGKHKDKKSQKERKQTASPKKLEQGRMTKVQRLKSAKRTQWTG